MHEISRYQIEQISGSNLPSRPGYVDFNPKPDTANFHNLLYILSPLIPASPFNPLALPGVDVGTIHGLDYDKFMKNKTNIAIA